ncbi:DUF4167 domain-containing protein [Caldovatus sp. SYSU G05006]|uniref:DUF4167 domain-containing protein n=2 Tax=Caldovatus aquaticus TaxID=2865671 RepID=A0ABS7F4A0_9PROT|nr:DUF4167 domain-containing protein [Caldovatus aquaticus]
MRGRGGHRHGGGGGQFRPGGAGGGGHPPLSRSHVFDSNGPDVRLRGTAQQLFEKYLQLGRDATSAGDRVMAESYFQHAEHYFRILNAINQAQQQQHQLRQQQRQHQQNGTEAPAAAGDGTGEQPEVNGHAVVAPEAEGDAPGSGETRDTAA